MSHSNSQSESFELLVRDAKGEYRLATGDEVLKAARQVIRRRVRRGTAMTSPQVVRDYLRTKLAELPHEVFVPLLLDTQHRLVQYVELFRGTLAQTSVYPREIVKVALAHNAAAMILAHNHPSGVAEPSRADELLTQTLKQALALIDVRVPVLRGPHRRPLTMGLLLNPRAIILHAGGDPSPTYLKGVHMHVMERLMPTPPQIPKLVTLGEAADRLAVSKRHLQRLVARGELPTVRVGECVRISVSVVIAYIASQTRVR